jgi:hypothetical protein
MDNTWFFALNYAAAHHLVFGRDFIWTWGPVAYLLVPFNLGHNLSHALIFQTIMWILIGLAFWDLSVRSNFRICNLQLFAIFLALSALNYSQELNPTNPFLPLALIFLVHFHLRGGQARLLVALVLLGCMPLVQFVGSIPVLGILAGFIVHRLTHPRPASVREAVLAIVVPFSVASVGALLTLGSFSATASYIKSSQEFAKGYVFAMSLPGEPLQLTCIIIALCLFAAALALLILACDQLGQFFVLILTIPGLFEFRHAIVRQDNSHSVQFFSFVALAFALVALAIPVERRVMEILSVTTLCSLFALSWMADSSSNFPRATNLLIGRNVSAVVWNVLQYQSLVASLQEAARQNAAEFGLPSELRQIVGQHSIAYLSPLYSNALAEELNLFLLPVPQTYAADTPYLDGRNSDWISSQGPQFLAFEYVAIDDRHPWTEAPATWAAVYRWYETKAVSQRYLLLQRRSQPRFDRIETIESRSIHFDEVIPIPDSAEPVFWTLRCAPNFEGRLRSIFFRVPEVTTTITLQNGHMKRYRAVLAVNENPTLGNRLPVDLTQTAKVLASQLNSDFSVRSLQFAGAGSGSYAQPCKLEFLRATN